MIRELGGGILCCRGVWVDMRRAEMGRNRGRGRGRRKGRKVLDAIEAFGMIEALLLLC